MVSNQEKKFNPLVLCQHQFWSSHTQSSQRQEVTKCSYIDYHTKSPPTHIGLIDSQPRNSPMYKLNWEIVVAWTYNNNQCAPCINIASQITILHLLFKTKTLTKAASHTLLHLKSILINNAGIKMTSLMIIPIEWREIGAWTRGSSYRSVERLGPTNKGHRGFLQASAKCHCNASPPLQSPSIACADAVTLSPFLSPNWSVTKGWGSRVELGEKKVAEACLQENITVSGGPFAGWTCWLVNMCHVPKYVRV